MAEHDERSVFHVTSLGLTARLFLAPHFRHLREQGVSVALACSPDPDSEQWCEARGVRYRPVPIRQDVSPLSDIRALLGLWGILRRERPWIVHAHMSKAGLVGLLAARLANVPVRVYHNHGMAMLGSRALRKWVLRAVERANSRLATHLLFCGESTREAAVRHGIATAGRATVLGNGSICGIDVDAFSPARRAELRETQRQRWEIPNRQVVAGFVGRIVRQKGIATLLEAWRRLPADVRQEAMLVIVGGRGDDDLTDQVRTAELDGVGVRYFGWTDDIVSCYAGFDLLVLPSLYEGLPYSVLEAQSMGLPVICTQVTGNVDAVIDGETGVHVPAGDAGRLSAAIAQLVRSPELRSQLGRRGRARIERSFRQQDVVRRMGEFYEAAGLKLGSIGVHHASGDGPAASIR